MLLLKNRFIHERADLSWAVFMILCNCGTVHVVSELCLEPQGRRKLVQNSLEVATQPSKTENTPAVVFPLDR